MISILASSASFVFADNSTQNYSYYQIGSSLNRYVQSGTNSADIVGRLLDISSYNQTMIYNRLLQFPTSGSDLTTVNSYITSIDSKLGVIRDSLGIGSSLENVLSNQSSNLQHLNTIINALSYWDNNHARSYDLSEMIFNIMDKSEDIVENTISIPVIVDKTSSIYTLLNTKLNSQTGITYYYNTRNSVDTNFTPNTITGYQNGYAIPYFSNDWSGGRYISNPSPTATPSLYDMMKAINYNLVSLNGGLFTPLTVYNVPKFNQSAINNTNIRIGSLADFFKVFYDEVVYRVANMSYMIADPDTIAAKRANASQEQTVLSNYTGNGSASASAADFGNIKDGVGSVKTGLNTNVSVSNIFNIFNNNDGYGFWSDDTRQELNSTGSMRAVLKANRISSTPLYDAKISELYNAMGVSYE